MVRCFHEASSPTPSKRLPSEAYRLAEAHQLGSPIKIYRDTVSIYHIVLVGLLATIDGVYFAIRVGIPLMAFYFGHKQSGNYSFLSTSATFRTDIGTQGELGGYISVYWLGLGLDLVFLIIGLILLIYSICQLVRKSRTYECTEGFVEIEGTGRIVASMRWDQIVTLWHRVIVSVGYRSGMIISHKYSIVGVDGVDHRIAYTHLWKRIEKELVRYSLPQIITKYQTGESISFGDIIVSIYGINLGADWLSWDEISLSSTTYAGENIVFFSKNSHKRLTIPISQTLNVCVLEALLNCISDQYL